MKKIIIGLICFIIIAIVGFIYYYYYIAFKNKEIKVNCTNYIGNIMEKSIDTINQTKNKIENMEGLEIAEKEKQEQEEENNTNENTNSEETNNRNNEETNNTTTSSNQNYIGEEESRDEIFNESNKEKAIKLAKEKWGEDASVYFTVAYTNGNTYNISVNSSETTQVLAWYSVNVETGEVQEN